MDYELAKQLREAGWPQDMGLRPIVSARSRNYTALMLEKDEPVFPTLRELIDACGDGVDALIRDDSGWDAYSGYAVDYYSLKEYGETPEEAVARLWLELNKK